MPFAAIARVVSIVLLFVMGTCFASEELVTSATNKGGDVVPYILNRLDPPPKYILILFPGGTGIVNPRMENGQLLYEEQDNFLVRSRKYWVDDDFATVTTDSSKDEARIQAILDDLKRRFPTAQVYLIGTSRGTYDTMALAAYLSDKIAGEVHTSSLSSISDFGARQYKNRQLVVHHKLDNCRVTSFASAEASHTRFGNDFIAMEGGVSIGNPCRGFAYHGYNGIEQETTAAIKQWIRQGRDAGASPQ